MIHQSQCLLGSMSVAFDCITSDLLTVQMKPKLTFAQRLLSESSLEGTLSKGNTSIDSPHSLNTPTPTRPNKNRFHHFKQQHHDLKNLLRMLESPQVEELEFSPQAKKPSPTKARRTQRRENLISTPVMTTSEKTIKESIWGELPRVEREDYKSTTSLILPEAGPALQMEEESGPKAVVTPARGEMSRKRGIPNNGNTCYINALVQCLFHLPHFNDYFVSQQYRAQPNGRPTKNIVEIYRSLYLAVTSPSGQGEVSTQPLKRSVSKMCSLFVDWAQEDAHEFMKELLSSVHCDLNRVAVRGQYRLLARQLEGASLEAMASSYWGYEKEREDSYIYDSFCGQTYHSIRCTNCQHESECFQNFLDLSLPIPPKTHSLHQLLDNYFEPEKLTDFYRCDHCGKSSKRSTKTTQPWRLPKFLIVHLKRSQFGKKNTDPIQLAPSLTLKKYISLSSDKSARFCQYSLCGVVMHRGVIDAGHYWCWVKEKGRWFELDDEKVREVSAEAFSSEIRGSSAAYILFYSSLYC